MGQWQSEEFRARVFDRIDALKLSERVEFLGVLSGEEKFSAFRRADVFCFPTFHNCEAFPVVLLEAAACGLPVVSTRWRGIPSIVDEGQTGFLVEPHNSDAVADRLAMLAGDQDVRLRLGRAARAKYEREYTFSRHAGRMRHALLETAGVVLNQQLQSVAPSAAMPTTAC
jgi:glycosyltransferase involved in cell wall biosynthesis